MLADVKDTYEVSRKYFYSSKSEKTLLMIGKMKDIEIIELLKKDKRNIIEVVEYLSIDDLYRIWLRYYKK